MPNIIQHKRNSVAGSVPSTGSISQGEIAINIADGKFYTKNSSNNVINLGVTSISGTLITPASGNFSSSLQINGTNVSVSGHSHTASNITDFNSSVSGLLPTIANSGDNRILTSTGSSIGINAETNATFDGTNFNVSGVINVDNLRLDNNTISSINTNGDLILSTNGTGRASVGTNNLASAVNSFVNGTNNVAASNVRRANNITSSTSTITVLGATAADFDNTTTNALQIRYFYNNVWNLITRTVSSATQSGDNVTVTLTSNVGAAAQTWSEVTVVNISETESMIGGTVGGISNIARGNYSTVGGGRSNTSSGNYNTVGGGRSNTSSAYASTVGGGISNTASGYRSTVGGGGSNTASGYASTVGGGRSNTLSGTDSTVGGGISNTASGYRSTVGGGGSNTSSGYASTVGGGSSNTASGYYSTVGGGRSNTLSGTDSTVGGGISNTASGYRSTVGGGLGNTSSGYYSIVGGGDTNTASGSTSTVGGGKSNTSSGYRSTVGGGDTNTASGSRSTVGGGSNNLASATNSFVNGTNNVAASKVRRANDITSSTSTITVLNAAAADFDNTTANALQIRYFYNNVWSLITRTVSSATQSGDNVTVTLTSNVGAAAQTWSEVTVVNISETESMIGGTVGGISNIARGNYSTVAGGRNNTSSGYYSIVGGGDTNTASGSTSTVGGGNSNTASGSYSTISGGIQAKASRYGENSHSSGRFANNGDAQHTVLIARKLTTNNTSNQVLFLDNSSARLTLPAKTTWTFTIKLSAYNDTDNAVAGWIYRGVIRRNDSNSTVLVGSLIEESWKETAMNNASSSVVADDTNEALEIRVTGITGKNIRWVAVIDISQVSYSSP